MLAENYKGNKEGIQDNKLPASFSQTLYERRAIRKYKDLPVDRKMIDRIIDAGTMAPSAMNKQPWKFHVLTGKDDISAFSKEVSKGVLKGIASAGIKGIVRTVWDFLHFSHKSDFLKEKDPVFHGAPVVIIISSPKDNEWAMLDIGMCAQNMMLMAKHMGLDTCPVGMVKYGSNSEIFNRLNVPKSDQINLAIILGYGDENPEPKERHQNNTVYL